MSRTVRDIDSGRAPQHDHKPSAAAAPQRLGGRALFTRRAAPVGHPAERSADEKAQKLSGRALMIARQKTGGLSLGGDRR